MRRMLLILALVALKASPYSQTNKLTVIDRGSVLNPGTCNGTIGKDGRRAHDFALLYRLTDEAFWLQGDDLYAAHEDRILTGLEWNLRYNFGGWKPKGYTDNERAVTFENGLFYRSKSLTRTISTMRSSRPSA